MALPEQHDFFAVDGRTLHLHSLYKAFAVGIFTDIATIFLINGIHRADDARGVGDAVQKGNYTHLVGHGEVKALHVYGARAGNGRAQRFWKHLGGDIAVVEALGTEAGLLHYTRGIAVHGIAEYADQLGAIVFLHAVILSLYR